MNYILSWSELESIVFIDRSIMAEHPAHTQMLIGADYFLSQPIAPFWVFLRLTPSPPRPSFADR